MKKILSLFALGLMTSAGAMAQTVIAHMSDFVDNGTNTGGVTEATLWKASEDKVYSFNGSSSYFSGITNDAVVAALEGDQYVTVAMYVYGNSLNGSPFGYGDGQDGLKYTFFGSTSVQVTTKGVADFGKTTLGSMQANDWNLVAFTVPGKSCSGSDTRYLSPAGHYTKSNCKLANMKDPSNKKFAIGSGDQGTAREVFNGLLANVTVMTSTSPLSIGDIQSKMATAPVIDTERNTNVTYTYKCDGVDDVAISQYQSVGSGFAAPVVPPFGAITSLSYTGTVTADNNTCIVNYTQALPFELGKVYHLGDRLIKTGTTAGNIQYYSYGDAADKKVPSRAGAPQCAKNYMWTFERVTGTFDQFYLKNLELGYVSTADGNGQQSVLGENKTPMKLYEYTGDGHQNGNKDFGFTDAAAPTNVFGDHASSHLGYWKPGQTGNEGSALRVVEISDAELDALATEAPEDPYVGYVGHHAAIQLPIYRTADIAAVKADATVANVNALFDNATTQGVEAYDVELSFDKIYRIVDFFGRVANAAPVADAEGALSNKGTIVTAGKKDADTFFRFVQSGDNVKIQHVNSGLYFGNPPHGDQIQFVDEANAAEFAMTPKAGANLKWLFKNGSEYINNNSSITRFDGWNSDGDGSQLNVIEAESLPVTISAAGYATLCSPVNLTVPEEVTVYTAKRVGDYLVAEVLKNHIPAGAAVILEAEAGTYDFHFVSGAAPVENNDLLGTCVAKAKADGDLVLGNEEGLGFYSLAEGVANLAANKAYFHVDPAAGESNLRITFDELTSIISAAKENGGQAIFDLQGRRVVKAQNGLFIQNGKKVIK